MPKDLGDSQRSVARFSFSKLGGIYIKQWNLIQSAFFSSLHRLYQVTLLLANYEKTGQTFWPLPIPEVNMKTRVVLVYIAFMMCDVKQVFKCLRASYISFSANYLFLSSACLFIEQLAHFLQIYRACSHFSVMRLANASQNFMFVLWLYLLCFSNINFNHPFCWNLFFSFYVWALCHTKKEFLKLFSMYLTNIFSRSYFMFKSVVYLGVNYESNFFIGAHVVQHLLNNQSIISSPLSHLPHT